MGPGPMAGILGSIFQRFSLRGGATEPLRGWKFLVDPFDPLSPGGVGSYLTFLDPHGEDNRRGHRQRTHPTRLMTPTGSADFSELLGTISS